MKNLISLAVVVVLVVGACSTQKYTWVHPEKDSQQYEADNTQCLAQSRGSKMIARMPVNTGGQAGSFSSGWDTGSTVEAMETRKTIHRQCMTDKGWRLQAVEPATE
jgi:hypothetical protein